jgi:hypothetical protein
MAKSKHATALFEVMNRTTSSPSGMRATFERGSTGGGIPTPKWWFKSRGGSDVKVIAPEAPVILSNPTPAVTTAAPEPEYVAPPVVEEPAPQRAPAAATVTPSIASSVEVPPVAVSVDSSRQLISLRLSYTSALIGGFGVFIALALAVLIGKGLSRGPATAIAGTSTQVLRQRAPTPGVMNIPRRSESSGANDSVEGSARPAKSVSTGTRNPQQAQPSFNDPRPPATFFTDDAHRSAGLNYAIIVSFPDREHADKAAEFLTKNGIACTVERDLPNWKLAWPNGCSVVGIRGFAKVSNNPALEDYKKSIMGVSGKFTTNRSGFSAFAPSMYLWRKSN